MDLSWVIGELNVCYLAFFLLLLQQFYLAFILVSELVVGKGKLLHLSEFFLRVVIIIRELLFVSEIYLG